MSANPFDQEVPMASNNGAGVDLSAFDDDFETAEVPEFDEVPDGKYQVRIDKAVLTHARSSGAPMIKWDLVVISGAQEGRHIFKNSVITSKSMPFIKGDLTKLGLDLSRISDLPGRIAEVLDKKVEITKRTKGDFSNVYFNKLLEIPSGTGADPKVPW